ncbi:MAG: hypothetical protein ACKVQS_06175 [Fimbriimonadaceae bacterium]
MKFWQIGAIGALAFILGCGGMGAYVPDGATGTGTPLQCAAITMSTNNDVFTSPNSDQEEILDIFNGVGQGLQSRAPGEATLNLTVSGLPSGMTFDFASNPVTVQLNQGTAVDIHYVTNGSIQPGTYNVVITAQEAGCTPVVEQVTVTVLNNNN